MFASPTKRAASGAKVQMPFINAVEVLTVAGAFLTFWVAPAVVAFVVNLRRRHPPEFAAAAQVADVNEPPAADRLADTGLDSPPQAIRPEATRTFGTQTLEEPTHAFQLDDLRRARVLETPGQGALGDSALQQAWEEGLQLADAHATAIGRTPLAASFAPQSRSFHGMRRLGDVRELRFLLFADLWPTSNDQATAEAAFEIGEAGVVAARVVRRQLV